MSLESPITEPNEFSETEQGAAKPVRAPSLLKAAGLIAAVTIFSKMLGFLRDWAVMYAYGTSLVSDAYYAAFQLPSFSIILLGGLGGPFHTATVAVFSRLIKDQDAPSERARRLASTFITLTGMVFTFLSILTFLLARPIMGLILHGAAPSLIDSAAAQLQVMSPCILAGGVVGILYGLSNIYNCFVWPSLSPVAMSVTILLGLWLVPGDTTGMVLAWSTLAGGLLQVVMQLPEFFRQKFTLKPSLDWKAPEIRQAGELLLPATVGTTIGQLVTYVDMFFAASLGAGGWSAVTLSNRLVQLPLGVLQTALLVPIFPRFSRAAAEGNFAEIKRNFKTGVISLWLISIPLLIWMMMYTEPLIRLIFQHGKFDARATELVSLALIYQALQIIPYFARDSITRVFYAFQDSRTPLMVGLLAIGVKALLNWLFVMKLHLGVGGITAAITMVTFINMFLLGVLSKKHIADLGFREMILPFAKLAMAGVLMMAASFACQTLLQPLFGVLSGPAQLWEYVRIALAALVGLLVYVLVALQLKVSEAQYLQERIGGRLLKRFGRIQ